jgi:pyruvate formate lyase activating enzyme
VLPLVDWVAMDVKARFDEHERVTGVRGSAGRAKQSRDLILTSGVACELHTIALDARHAPRGRAAESDRLGELATPSH